MTTMHLDWRKKAQEEALRQDLLVFEKLGRAKSLACTMAELAGLDALIARVNAGLTRDQRVAVALAVQREARQAGCGQGRAAYGFLLERYAALARAPGEAAAVAPEPAPVEAEAAPAEAPPRDLHPTPSSPARTRRKHHFA
mgnify:CR=1 FL=1